MSTDAQQEPAFDAKGFVRQLTSRPGVYRMIGADGEVLYVGKARNLKRRVSSYFTRVGSERIANMVAQIRDVEVTVTHTEDEALVLEDTLIKRHRPRYNVLLRDDKSYPYIFLHEDHPFPRLTFRRGMRKGAGRYFGPYPSAGAVRTSLTTLQKVFLIRNCTDTFFANRSRPCLQYQIRRCSAPCVGFISKADYRQDVDAAVRFLEGKQAGVLEDLSRRMDRASERLDFELAARLRDQIATLRRLQDRQFVAGHTSDLDIVCAEIRADVGCVVVVSIRGGRNLGHRSYFPRLPEGADRHELLSAFLSQYYLARKAPPEILVEEEPAEREWLQEVLGREAGRKVRIKHRLRGLRVRWRDMARQTLDQALSSRLSTSGAVAARIEALQEAFDMDSPPQRMECFDISHTRGEATVASCVVFENGEAQKSAYRRFNIEGVEPGDDYAAIAQAVRRRFARIKRGEVPVPDILFIDGGQGQLKSAQAALDELEIEDVLLVAIAKGPSRKPGREQLFLPGRKSALILAPDSKALHLIQQIRDEAHRFAITGHRRRRGQARTRSLLDDIEGLGAKRRQRLLKAFGGVRQIARAGVEELARVDGISRAMAQRIYEYFHESA